MGVELLSLIRHISLRLSHKSAWQRRRMAAWLKHELQGCPMPRCSQHQTSKTRKLKKFFMLFCLNIVVLFNFQVPFYAALLTVMCKDIAVWCPAALHVACCWITRMMWKLHWATDSTSCRAVRRGTRFPLFLLSAFVAFILCHSPSPHPCYFHTFIVCVSQDFAFTGTVRLPLNRILVSSSRR